MRVPLNKKFWVPSLFILLIISILAFLWRGSGGSKAALAVTSLSTLPPVIIWAWERPEQLEFIDKDSVGVAFLAKTITLSGEKVFAKPRLQPLKVLDGTKLVAVVRIEVDRKDAPVLSAEQLEQTVAELVEASKLPRVLALQIDFDATTSQREFYRGLLQLVRRDLPDSMPLSITALASWCVGDNWLTDLPINEAVPMFFRMGVDRRQFQSRLETGTNFVGPPCQNAAGVSTDEVVAIPKVDRLYIFDPRPWSKQSLDRAMEAYSK
jgi:hypothetical protein